LNFSTFNNFALGESHQKQPFESKSPLAKLHPENRTKIWRFPKQLPLTVPPSPWIDEKTSEKYPSE
jgi:hypothetical protein